MRSLWPGHRRTSRGAMLAELIMSTVVGLLLLSVLPGFYFAYVRLWRQETARLGASQRSSFVVRRMKLDIRNARKAATSPDGTILTLTMPMLIYDSGCNVMGVAVAADGSQIDGDTITYYFERDPNGTGSAGGNIYRQLTRASGTAQAPRLVADSIYPGLNPLSATTGSPLPLFYHDDAKDTVVVTVTASEPAPAEGTFAPASREPICLRDGGALVRVATESHPEGVVRCERCGDQVKPATELVTYRTEMRLRNH
jgi:Tfp pilus assembly protein PilW